MLKSTLSDINPLKDDKSDDEGSVEGDGWSNPPLDIPGILDYFVVAWTNPFGQITIDQDIKLFEFKVGLRF